MNATIEGQTTAHYLAERIERRLGVAVQTSWGMTELSPLGTVTPPDATARDPAASGRPAVGVDLLAWPKRAPEQFVALRATLARGGPARPADLARRFRGASDRKVGEMLRTLAALGQARDAGGGRFAG